MACSRPFQCLESGFISPNAERRDLSGSVKLFEIKETIIPEINMFHLIFKQDFRNFCQMESAQQASHYLQGLSRCSVPFCHWTFRKRKLDFLFKWKAP
jgi:hypothetical protein